jgi:hypothetical protein
MEEASEIKRTLKAVCKRIEAEEMRKYEAIGEEAAERRTQQECSLSGGVYLRHRSRKASFLKHLLLCFSRYGYYNTRVRGVPVLAFGRAGVQETVPLFD